MLFRRISLLTVLLLSLSATSAFAETYANVSSTETPQFIAQGFGGNGPGFGEGRRGRRGGDILEELDLTEAQKTELESIRTQYQPRIDEKRDVLFSAHQTLREMMASDTSPDELRRQHEQVQDLAEEMSDLRFESMLEMREVLTPEQREEFAQLMEERRESRGPGRRGGRGFRGGRFDN